MSEVDVTETFDSVHGIMFSPLFTVDLHIHSSPPCHSQTCTKTIAEMNFYVSCSVRGAPTNTDVLEWLFAGSTLPDDIIPMPQTETSGDITTYTSTLVFPPLQLSHAGVYTCRVRGNERLAEQVTININGVFNSLRASSDAYIMHRHFYYTVPVRVHLTHSPLLPDLTTEGECVTFTCTVELGPPGLVDFDLSLIAVDAQLCRDGAPLALSGPTVVTDTTLTYSTQLDLSVRNNAESYTCVATVRPRDESPYIDTVSEYDVITVSSTGIISYNIFICHSTHQISYRCVYQSS